MSTPVPSAAAPSFSDLGVPRALVAALEGGGITSPFSIQAAALPDALQGRDVCGMAPTGSGKTLAFGLAILTKLAARARPRPRGRRHPSALVLVPTRELAAQIEAELAPLARAVGVGVTSVYGGVGYAKQLAALARGTDVLVACPGRLADLLARRCVELSFVETVVVDEADKMADMGFLPEVRRLLERTRPTRQVLLFSATLEGPVERLVRDYQRDPARHEVAPVPTERGDVQHHFWRVEHHDRVAVTAETISARGPAMVFCRTKRGADRLSHRLAQSGLQSAAIHGDRSQSQRERALLAFRSGRLDVLVATDVAARGIHVAEVPLVVHFDPPADHTDYVHRAGRTGRAGAAGIVVSLLGKEHVDGARRMQRRLGLSGTIAAPDVPALAVFEPARTDGPRSLRTVQAARPGREGDGRSRGPVNRPGTKRRPRRRQGGPAPSRG